MFKYLIFIKRRIGVLIFLPIWDVGFGHQRVIYDSPPSNVACALLNDVMGVATPCLVPL